MVPQQIISLQTVINSYKVISKHLITGRAPGPVEGAEEVRHQVLLDPLPRAAHTHSNIRTETFVKII